jgi:hypothetical protein
VGEPLIGLGLGLGLGLRLGLRRGWVGESAIRNPKSVIKKGGWGNLQFAICNLEFTADKGAGRTCKA